MEDQGQMSSIDRLSDVAEVGMSTQLLFAIPLLRALVQSVAESDGAWKFLNVSIRSGAWVGVARRSDEEQLLVSTSHSKRVRGPFPKAVHDALLGHGFDFKKEHEGYVRLIAFETDDAFDVLARLIVGTFSHVWGSAMDDHIDVELRLSLPEQIEGGS
jgi:hypothetical protein